MNPMKLLDNSKGQVLGYILVILILLYFICRLILFLMHREQSVQWGIGPF
ncbi:hypothetical protein ACFL3D_04355 [Candidatus Omnitrophota bacterium]